MPVVWSSARRPRPCSSRCICPTLKRCLPRSRSSRPRRTRRPSPRSDPAPQGLLVLAALPLCRRSLREREAIAGAGGDIHPSLCLLPPDQACQGRADMMRQAATSPLLKVKNLVVEYVVGNKVVHAVSDVSLEIARGETLGLVG